MISSTVLLIHITQLYSFSQQVSREIHAMIQERFALTPSYIPKAPFYHILIKYIGCIKLTRYYFTQYAAVQDLPTK